MAFQHQSQGKTVLLMEHLLKMLGAEAQAVGFNADVRLHHSGAHDVLHAALLQRVPHGANGAALFRLEHLADGNGIDTVAHNRSSNAKSLLPVYHSSQKRERAANMLPFCFNPH